MDMADDYQCIIIVLNGFPNPFPSRPRCKWQSISLSQRFQCRRNEPRKSAFPVGENNEKHRKMASPLGFSAGLWKVMPSNTSLESDFQGSIRHKSSGRNQSRQSTESTESSGAVTGNFTCHPSQRSHGSCVKTANGSFRGIGFGNLHLGFSENGHAVCVGDPKLAKPFAISFNV